MFRRPSSCAVPTWEKKLTSEYGHLLGQPTFTGPRDEFLRDLRLLVETGDYFPDNPDTLLGRLVLRRREFPGDTEVLDLLSQAVSLLNT